MRIISILACTLYLLCLFNPGNTILVAQQTTSTDITVVTNHETVLQNWRPYADIYLTFEIEVTVPADFSSGTLVAALQNVTDHPGKSGNVPSRISCPTEEEIDERERFETYFPEYRENLPDLECETDLSSADRDFDLLLLKEDDKNADWTVEGDTLTYSLSTGTDGTVQTMNLRVDCEDYAAYGELVLTISDSGYTSNTVTIKIPKDTNGNKIADSWRNDHAKDYDPDADADIGPNTRTGDNITVLNEYRGLNVNSSWTETDPDAWDVFIRIDESLSTYGIGTASALPSMTLHEMGTNEVTYSDGIVYHNQIARSGNSTPDYVRAIRLEADTDSELGSCRDILGALLLTGPPSVSSRGMIYINSIDTFLSTCFEGTDLTSIKQDYIEAIIGHEIGHGVNLWHCPCFDDVNCYMWNTPDAVLHHVTAFASHHNEDYALKGTVCAQASNDDLPDRIYIPGTGVVAREDEDVNADGVVNILDLLLVASNIGTSGPHVADVNGSGSVDINDLVAVANVFSNPTSSACTCLREDVNRDGVVDILDLNLVASNIGVSTVGHNAGHVADVNGDCYVNIQDLVLVAAAFGNTAAAPEE